MGIVLAVLVGVSSVGAMQTPGDKSTTAKVPSPVNLNTATVEQLEALPGIGAKTAALIVAYRQKNPFKKPEELMNVKGIGEKAFLRIRTLVTVGAPKADSDAKATATDSSR
jgi:competence protein ComEA